LILRAVNPWAQEVSSSNLNAPTIPASMGFDLSSGITISVVSSFSVFFNAEVGFPHIGIALPHI
jgi:hypothetical protein